MNKREGVVDIPRLRAMAEAAGYKGVVEAKVLSRFGGRATTTRCYAWPKSAISPRADRVPAPTVSTAVT